MHQCSTFPSPLLGGEGASSYNANGTMPPSYGGGSSYGRRPTLYHLLARLSDPSITTVDQRLAIRNIITDYLNNDISQAKVFTYIGQVLGFTVLDQIIRNLIIQFNSATANVAPTNQQIPQPPSSPITIAQNVHAAGPPLQVSGSRGGGRESSALNYIQSVVDVGNNAGGDVSANAAKGGGSGVSPVHESQDGAKRDESSLVRRQNAMLFRVIVRPLRLLYPEASQHKPLLTYGHQPFLFDRKAFFIGGMPRPSEGAAVIPSSSCETMRVVDLSDFHMISNKTVGDIPKSMIGHTLHFGTFLSGPLVVLFGGLACTPQADNNSNSSCTAQSSLLPQFSQTVSSTDTVEESSQASHLPILLNNLVSGLDLQSRRWIKLHEGDSHRPPPRHSHLSAICPVQSEVVTGPTAVYSDYLIVFGGVGCSRSFMNTPEYKEKQVDDYLEVPSESNLAVLNDLWILSFVTGKWFEVSLPTTPDPRFGSSLSWISGTALLMYGGEGRRESAGTGGASQAFATPSGERLIFDDTWLLHLDSSNRMTDEIEGVGSNKTAGSGVLDEPPPQLSWKKCIAAGPPRAHHAAVALTACLPPRPSSAVVGEVGAGGGGGTSRAVWSASLESAMSDLMDCGWTAQRVVFLISGLTQDGDKKINETPSCLIGMPYKKSDIVNTNNSVSKDSVSEYVVVWKSIEEIETRVGYIGKPFKGRRNHMAFYFETLADIPARQILNERVRRSHTLTRFRKKQRTTTDNTANISGDGGGGGSGDLEVFESEEGSTSNTTVQTASPVIVIAGGYNEATRKVREDLWVLRLSRFTPRLLNQQDLTQFIAEQRLLSSLILSGTQCTPALKSLFSGLEALTQPDDANYTTPTAAETVTDVLAPLRVLRHVWTDRARSYQPYVTQAATSAGASGLVWALASATRSPLTAVGHLVNNALQPEIGATKIEVSLCRWYDRYDALIVSDDGRGLNYWALHALLRRYGRYSGDEPLGEIRRPDVYGMGFKLALGALTHNALVITKTTATFGVGLYSTALNNVLDNASFAVPIALWSALDGTPVTLQDTEDAEFGQTLRLILQNTPLGSTAALEDQFMHFGDKTGTRIIFFSLRKDLPHFELQDERILTSTASSKAFLSQNIKLAPGSPNGIPTSRAVWGSPGLPPGGVAEALRRAGGLDALCEQMEKGKASPVGGILDQENVPMRDTDSPNKTSPAPPPSPPGDVVMTSAAVTQASPELVPLSHENSEVASESAGGVENSEVQGAGGGSASPPPNLSSTSAAAASRGKRGVEDGPRKGGGGRKPKTEDNHNSTTTPMVDVAETTDKESRKIPPWQQSQSNHPPVVDENQDSVLSTERHHDTVQCQSIKLSHSFPLWRDASESLDYNLATYLYWSHLHSDCEISLNSMPLIPIQHTNATTGLQQTSKGKGGQVGRPRGRGRGGRAGQAASLNRISPMRSPNNDAQQEQQPTNQPQSSNVDRYSNSLYRYLQKRLHCQLELPYLFNPKFGDHNAYGIVGFLNDPTSKQPPLVCETGVLLYYKGRLINRALVSLPLIPEAFELPTPPNKTDGIVGSMSLTCLINVPNFLVPRVTKEGFVAESDHLAFQDFYDRLEETLAEYVSVYADAAQLTQLQDRYVEKFDSFRKSGWAGADMGAAAASSRPQHPDNNNNNNNASPPVSTQKNSNAAKRAASPPPATNLRGRQNRRGGNATAVAAAAATAASSSSASSSAASSTTSSSQTSASNRKPLPSLNAP